MVWQLDRETFSHIVRDASAKRREAFQDFLTLGQVVVMVGSVGFMVESDPSTPFGAFLDRWTGGLVGLGGWVGQWAKQVVRCATC